MMQIVIPEQISNLTKNRKKKYIYVSDMDMRKRSEGISEQITNQLGLELDQDTIIIADNSRQNIRCFVGVTPRGIFELRYKLFKGRMIPMSEKDGLLNGYNYKRNGALESYDN